MHVRVGVPLGGEEAAVERAQNTKAFAAVKPRHLQSAQPQTAGWNSAGKSPCPAALRGRRGAHRTGYIRHAANADMLNCQSAQHHLGARAVAAGRQQAFRRPQRRNLQEDERGKNHGGFEFSFQQREGGLHCE